MKNKDIYSFLPENTLNWLYLNVCRHLQLFERFNPRTIWERPIERCIDLEQDPDSISSFILVQEEDKGRITNSDIMHYHQFLVRVYILLYYRHRDEELYNEDIFPILKDSMGHYGEEKVIKDIQQKLDKRIESDKKAHRYKTYTEYANPYRQIDDDDYDVNDAVEPQKVLYNKVSFELFIRLLEKCKLLGNDDSGTFKIITSNKSRVGELWQMFTGKSGEEFRRYCSKQSYVNDHTLKDIERLNKKLKEIGIDLQL